MGHHCAGVDNCRCYVNVNITFFNLLRCDHIINGTKDLVRLSPSGWVTTFPGLVLAGVVVVEK